MQRILSIVSVFFVLQTLSGCHRFKAPPTYPHEDKALGAAKESPRGLDGDPPVPLVLLPGDTITVRASSNDSQEYEGLVVDSEGKVHVPVIGAAQVVGLAPQQAERTIEGMLQKVDRFVRVNVLVTEWGGHFATVIGAVAEEGAQVLSPGMRVAELVAAAGGPLRTTQTTGTINFVADIDGARLIRDNKVVDISLRLALNGDPRHNVFVHAGDQLFVPPGLGKRIAVIGADARAGGMVDYRPGLRLTEALATAGGINAATDEKDIRIIRGSLKKPLVYQYDLLALVNGKGGDIELAAGDVVFVGKHWSAKMGDFLARITPLVNLGLTGMTTWIAVQNLKVQREIIDRLNDPVQPMPAP